MRKIVLGTVALTFGAGVVFIGMIVAATYQVLREQGRFDDPLDLREIWDDMQSQIEAEWADFLDDTGLR